jgi:hypothetical protein
VLRSTAGSVALSYSTDVSDLLLPLLWLLVLLLTTPAAAVVGWVRLSKVIDCPDALAATELVAGVW